MQIYGLRGFNHAWAKLITVLSPQGKSELLAYINPAPEIELEDGGAHSLPQYRELQAGGLEKLIDHYHIEILDKPAWDRLKAELGAEIWR